AVPDRRRPRALLDGLRDPRVAAGREGRRNRRGVAAVDAVRVADVRAPAAARVLEHAGVVEGALGGLELGVRPGGAERVGTRSAGLAGRRVDAALVRIARDVEDLLLRCAGLVDPALDDLDALERAARSARILHRQDRE